MGVANKATTLAEIRHLREEVLKKQDLCREEIGRLKRSPPEKCKPPASLTWANVALAMEDQTAPLTHQDRMALTGAKWDEDPDRKKFDLIDDEDVAAATYFLNEVVQQLRRLRTMVAFFSRLKINPLSEGAFQAYALWTKHSLYLQLAAERLAAGDPKGAADLGQCAKATVSLFEVVVPANFDLEGAREWKDVVEWKM